MARIHRPAGAPPTDRRPRSGALAPLLAVVALVASGCLRIDGELSVDPERRLFGTLDVGISAAALAERGIDPDTVRAEVDADPLGWFFTLDLGGIDEGETIVQSFDRGGRVGAQLIFRGVDPERFRVDGRSVFTDIGDGAWRFELPVAAVAAPIAARHPVDQAAWSVAVLELDVEFPNEVVTHNGELEGATVSWRFDGTEIPAPVLADGGGPVMSAETNASPYRAPRGDLRATVLGLLLGGAFVGLGGWTFWRWYRRSAELGRPTHPDA